MATPLGFLRKNSTGLMVILVILSMLVFTLDSLFSSDSQQLWLLGLLAGGAIFGISGIKQGKWLPWSIGGAALGCALGIIMPLITDNGLISTSFGTVDNDMLQELDERRAVANTFVAGITGLNRGFFGTRGMTPSDANDLVFGEVLRQEATRLGLSADKELVEQFIARVVEDSQRQQQQMDIQMGRSPKEIQKLTKERYLKVRNSLVYRNKPVQEDLLFEILGEQLLPRMVLNMTYPDVTPPGPGVYWNYYSRTRTSQKVHVAALDVEEFLAAQGEPSDGEVEQLFAEHASKLPGSDGPGSPGFMMPRRAKLAWLEVDSSDPAALGVEPVTDEDIQTRYDELVEEESPQVRKPFIPESDPEEEGSSTEEGRKLPYGHLVLESNMLCAWAAILCRLWSYLTDRRSWCTEQFSCPLY